MIFDLNTILTALLDNATVGTFLGTILAGVLVANYGFYLYGKEKMLDLKYDDIRHLRQLASSLFVVIVNAEKEYQGYANIYSEEYSWLGSLMSQIDREIDPNFHSRLIGELSDFATEINTLNNKLVAHFKMVKNHEEYVEILTNNVSALSIYLNSAIVLERSSVNNRKEYIEGFNGSIKPIKGVLQKIMDN